MYRAARAARTATPTPSAIHPFRENLRASQAELAEHALREAARIASGLRASARATAQVKPDRSPVSVADYAVQAVVARRLAARDSSAVIIAEEDGQGLRGEANAALRAAVVRGVRRAAPDATEREVLEAVDRGGPERPGAQAFWTLDPVDGTKGFLSRGQYAIALARVEGGQVVLGALACPDLGTASIPFSKPSLVFWPSRGVLVMALADGGAWMSPLKGKRWQRLHVSSVSDPRQARVLTSGEPTHRDSRRLEEVRARLGLRRKLMPLDSQAKYALLASGDFDLILRLPARQEEEKIWDFAAAELIVREAGGRVTDLEGRRLRFDGGAVLPNPSGVLAAGPALHAEALAAVRATGRTAG